MTFSIVHCGMQLNFGVNLPPFVLRLPRFKLPPVRMSVTFNHSPDSAPLKIHFPGISITNNNQQHDSWSDNSVAAEPEPEPELDHFSHPDPEPESEHETLLNDHHYHQHHQYDDPIINHGRSYDHHTHFDKKLVNKENKVGSYHLQQRSRRDSIKQIHHTHSNQCTNCLNHGHHWTATHQYKVRQSSNQIPTSKANNLRLTLMAPLDSNTPI